MMRSSLALSTAEAARGVLSDQHRATNHITNHMQHSALQSSIRAPKEPPRRKARLAAECEQLEQLPNIGPSLAGDLRSLGIQHPAELATRDAFELYRALCTLTAKRHDPCVLDTFIAATAFMRGSDPKPWWAYTAQRKLDHPGI